MSAPLPPVGDAPDRTLLVGARLVDASGVVDDGWVLVEGTTIAGVGSGRPSAEAAAGAVVIDVDGATLTPGLIDLHSHGAGGHSFDDGEEAILAGVAVHRAHGTTRSVISLVTAPLDDLVRSVGAVERARRRDPGILGAHLEGPFIAPGRKGAHDPRHIVPPSLDAVERIAALAGTVRQITIAPELPGAEQAIAQLTEQGIRVAVGHTETDFAGARSAFERGATILTHAFNAMAPIHHRDPGPIVAALDDERVVLELILDGIHVHPRVAALLAAAAPGRVALVSDSMAAAASVDGPYRLGSLDVTVADGAATLPDGTIAGSTLTLERAVRFACDEVGIDEVAAVASATSVPAAVIGEGHRLGLLAPGYTADLVWWDADGEARRVWLDGAEIDIRR